MNDVCDVFGPIDRDVDERVVLTACELQALKYKDIDRDTMVVAAEKMGISKSVFGEIYTSARHKVALALVESKQLHIVCDDS